MFSKLADTFAKKRGPGPPPDGPVATLRDGGMKNVYELVAGDIVIVSQGEVIPCDGIVVDGMALVDESAITGESAPVVRESGGDRSAVLGGTRVQSSRIVVKVTGPSRAP